MMGETEVGSQQGLSRICAGSGSSSACLGSLSLQGGLLEARAGAVSGAGLEAAEPPGSEVWGAWPPLSRDEALQASQGSASPQGGRQVKAERLSELLVNS